MKIAVVGAGKMGLPLAAQMAHRGGEVTACDINAQTVATINAGQCPFDEPGVPEMIAANVAAGRLKATTDTVGAVKNADTVVIIVPAVLTKDNQADLRALEAATAAVVAGMHPGLLVSYETTLPVGTTRNHFLPLLEKSGGKAGRDFFLVFSPERVKSQLVLKHLTDAPKVVGGIDAESTRRGVEFYKTYVGAPVRNVGTTEAAEMVKLAGMIYRDAAIGLSNQLARYAEAVGVDFSSILEPINTDGEASLLQPGIGVGGHCAPVYPYFMIHHARRMGLPVTISELARETNDGQALHAVTRLEKALGSLAGKTVMILGLGFRPEVKEHICSTAFLLQPALKAKGATVTLHDPYYSDDEIRSHGFQPGQLTDRVSAVVLNTAHRPYLQLDFAAMTRNGLEGVVDGRNTWDPVAVRAVGLTYVGIGRP